MKRLKNIYTIGLNSTKEYFYSKVLSFFIVFSLIMVLFAILLGVMAVDNEKRILIDFGLAVSEIAVLAFSIFYGSMTIQKEIETKTIYLIVSRPVLKSDYILGKLLGLYMTSGLIYIILSLINFFLLIFKDYEVPHIYYIAVIFSFFKIMLISTFALLITSFTTSVFSSILISILIWLCGHFIAEMKYLFDKMSGLKLYILQLLIFLLPNFQLFNLRDTIQISEINYCKPLLYFASYLLILLLVNILVFRKKEF